MVSDCFNLGGKSRSRIGFHSTVKSNNVATGVLLLTFFDTWLKILTN